MPRSPLPLAARLLGALLLATSLLAVPAPARGDEPSPPAGPKKPETEVDVFPLIGGDGDVGFGGGGVFEMARHEPGRKRDRWSVQIASLTTFKLGNGKLTVPYQDDYALFTARDLIPGLRDLEIRPSFTAESTQKFYGLGDASPLGPNESLDAPAYEYGRVHPTLVVRARLALTKALSLRVGDSLTWNTLRVDPTTRLAQQAASGTPEQRRILGRFDDHFVDFFEQALVLDTRDDEIEPTSGQWHQLELRESPGGSGAFPYRYLQVDAQARAYVTPIKDRLTFAGRIVGDVLFGDPPFYELARFEDTFALGGANGVRGVPGQRYYGKTKLFGTAEARVFLFEMHALSKAWRIGAAAFVDAGRVWTDSLAASSLDGDGLGLKVGAGGGLRIKQGQSLVVRLDLAWSPDARPIGGYFAAGEIF